VEYLQLLSKFKVVQCNLQTDEISELPRSGWGGSSLIWSCSIKYILVKKHSWLKEPLFVDDCPLGKSWFSMLMKRIYTSPSVTGNLISSPCLNKGLKNKLEHQVSCIQTMDLSILDGWPRVNMPFDERFARRDG